MPKDFAKKNKYSRSSMVGTRKPVFSTQLNWTYVFAIIAGVVIGLFILSLIFLRAHHSKQDSQKQLVHLTKKVKHKLKPKIMVPSQPEFAFYSMLPKEKVWLPKSAVTSDSSSSQAKTPVTYMLQVASFKHRSDAVVLKNKLVKDKYPVIIKPNQNNTWYRVWLGPYKTLTEVQTAQVNVSIKDNLSGLILEIKKQKN